MERFIKYRFFKAGIFFILSLFLLSKQVLKIKADYIIYSHDDKYLYASGSAIIQIGEEKITGTRFYFSIPEWNGLVAGDVVFRGKKYDLVFLYIKKGKLLWQGIVFGGEIKFEGEKLSPPLLKFPDELKKAALYFEARQISVDENGRVKGSYVQPYTLGTPSIPVKNLILDLGKPPEKTNIRPGTLRYSREEGAFLGVMLDVKGKFYQGLYEFEYFERGIFKIPGEKRGIIFSGYGGFGKKGNKHLLDNSIFYTTSGKYLDFSLSTSREGKVFAFFTQTRISTREYEKPYYWVSSSLRFKKYEYFQPEIQAGWNYRDSYTLGVLADITPFKNVKMNLAWMKSYLEEPSLTTNTQTTQVKISYNPSIFNFTTSANVTDDLVEKTRRKDLSMNLDFTTVEFLEKSFSISFSAFLMFSKFPYGQDYSEKFSPGVRINLSGVGFEIPLGFIFTPGVDINQIWEEGKPAWTEFNYFMSVHKELWKFKISADLSMNSRYKSGGFWVEGYNNYFINGKFEFLSGASSINSVFYFNREFELERISLTGDLGLPLDFRFRFFSIYNSFQGKVSTLEAYLEKNLRNAIKVQIGYSLIMKKYFFRIIPL